MTDGEVVLRDVRGPSALGGGWRRSLELLYLIASMEFKRTYFGTVLGYLWSLCRPLLLFAVLLLVFTHVVRLGSSVAHYPVLLLLNIVLFGFFQEATTVAVGSVVNQEAVVRKTQFPRLVIPLAVVLTSVFNLALNLVVAFVFILAFGVTPTWHWVLFGGVLLSAPAGGSYQVTVASGMNVSGQNFADVLTSIAVPLTLPPSTPFPAQGSGNADYVEAVYRAVLDRNADAAGLASWTSLLNSGALSRLQVVQGIRNSAEHFTQEVEAFYLTLLNRAADPLGLQNWVQQLEGGMKEEQIAFYFLDSPEYLSQGDKHFVDQMYLSLLGRSFDSAGEANWLSQLSAGTLTHEQVITDFLYSTESLTRLTEGYYEVFLQRQADPGGLSGWVGALQQGTPFLTIGQLFLSSDEFYNEAAAQG